RAGRRAVRARRRGDRSVRRAARAPGFFPALAAAPQGAGLERTAARPPVGHWGARSGGIPLFRLARPPAGLMSGAAQTLNSPPLVLKNPSMGTNQCCKSRLIVTCAKRPAT